MPTSNTPELSQEAWEAWLNNSTTQRVLKVLKAHSLNLQAQWAAAAWSGQSVETPSMREMKAGSQAMSDLSRLSLETFRKYEASDDR